MKEKITTTPSIKKIIQKKIKDFSLTVFEDQSESEASTKVKKSLGKDSKKLTRSINSLVKKVKKKKSKLAKQSKKDIAKKGKTTVTKQSKKVAAQ